MNISPKIVRSKFRPFSDVRAPYGSSFSRQMDGRFRTFYGEDIWAFYDR